jgi:hypothetical protein
MFGEAHFQMGFTDASHASRITHNFNLKFTQAIAAMNVEKLLSSIQFPKLGAIVMKSDVRERCVGW